MLRDKIATPQKSVHRARRLRYKETPAEKRLWLHLRHRKFHGIKFRRQVPLGNFIVDFLCVPLKLIIELDGAFHEDTKGYDQWRDRYLKEQGFTVLRFENRVTFESPESILESITAHLSRHTPSPCPLPPHTG